MDLLEGQSSYEEQIFISVYLLCINSILCLILGLLKECYDLISQALTLFSSVCGVLHEDVCMCLRLLGRLSYILGENADVNIHYVNLYNEPVLNFLNQADHSYVQQSFL